MIMNGSRRRTPGGVYLYLVKNDEHLPQEKIREIFFVDKKAMNDKKKSEASSKRQEAVERMKNLGESKLKFLWFILRKEFLIFCFFLDGLEKDLPALLTRAEVSTQQIAEEARLRRGEGMERNPVDSDRTVINPPPSPATDDPDHSEQPTVQRTLGDYSDDFLDLDADIDSMEMFWEKKNMGKRFFFSFFIKDIEEFFFLIWRIQVENISHSSAQFDY